MDILKLFFFKLAYDIETGGELFQTEICEYFLMHILVRFADQT